MNLKNACKDKKNKLNLWNAISKSIAMIYVILIGGAFAICIFATKIEFARMAFSEKYFPILIQVLFGTVFIVGLFNICRTTIPKKENRLKTFLILSSIVLCIIQVYAVYCYYFYTDWDPPTLINLASGIVHGENVSEYNDYFSRYPNNLFLAYIFASITKVIHCLGMHFHEYFAILIIQCILNSISGLLVALCLDMLLNDNKITILGYIIYIFLVGMSPWVSIPYSDSMGLIFPVLILYLYLNRNKKLNPTIMWFLIAMLSYIGYKIKPQIFIVFIAIALRKIIEVIENRTVKKALFSIIGIICGVACAAIIVKGAIQATNIVVDKNKTFNIQHFFMMGMNPEDKGVWSGKDVEYSGLFTSAEERNAADMEMAKKRIETMGVTGVTKLLIQKTLTNYKDGTFCWAGEGDFFKEILDKRNVIGTSFFRKIYYTRSESDTGTYNVLWANFEQMIWMCTLMFSLFAFKMKKSNEAKDIVMLAIIGLTIFELLFEARARYLFTYVPFYIILAMYGIHYLDLKINET